MFNNNNAKELKSEVSNLEYDLEQARKERDNLQDTIDRFNRDKQLAQRKHDDRIEDKDHELQLAQKANVRAVEEKKAEINLLKNRIEVLEDLVEDSNDLQRKEVELEAREAILEASEATVDTFDAKLAEERQKAVELGDTKYKGGYADGLADGLRKAHEITAEDRRQSNQIAALAAASHQPDATKQIAAAIAKDVARALPSGQNLNATQTRRKK